MQEDLYKDLLNYVQVQYREINTSLAVFLYLYPFWTYYRSSGSDRYERSPYITYPCLGMVKCHRSADVINHDLSVANELHGVGINGRQRATILEYRWRTHLVDG